MSSVIMFVVEWRLSIFCGLLSTSCSSSRNQPLSTFHCLWVGIFLLYSKFKYSATDIREEINNLMKWRNLCPLLYSYIKQTRGISFYTPRSCPSMIWSDTLSYLVFQYGKEEEDLDAQRVENVLKVDVLGLMFIIFFLFILIIQFGGMIVHR